MAVSKAQQKAVHKYVKANYDRLELTLPKGQKEEVKNFAAAQGESVNAFIARLIEEAMSNRERIISLLDNVPDYKMGYILAYVQGITADEEADDAFCQRMIENYENDPDPEKDKTYTLEECKREWGLA